MNEWSYFFQGLISQPLNFINTENKKIEIILKDEKYFEQVIITKPDITLKGEEGVSPKISFYYGIGYKYKSIGKLGYFEENIGG